MANQAPFTELDFFQIKENLKNYLKSQNQFQDYDFEGSNMNVLLDILAKNTFQNNFYNNMAFSEMFLDSAQLRENAMSHAKELNYVAGSRNSARANLNLRFNTNVSSTSSLSSTPPFIVIPRHTKFKAQCGTKTYTFLTDETTVVKPTSGGAYRIEDLKVYEGKIIKEYYTIDTTKVQEFVLNNENVDISSIRITVYDSSATNANSTEFVRTNSIFGVDAVDEVFYVEAHFDNLYKVDFGRNKFGKQPENGQVVEIEYRVTKGAEANGAGNFSAVTNIGGYIATVRNNGSNYATQGSERETLDDIRFFAPKSIQVQERAVTKKDYEILLMNQFPNIQTISVYGGDEVDPPQYGKAIISVDVYDADGASETDIKNFRDYIRTKTPLTIEPVFLPAKFMYVDLEIKSVYNTDITSKSASQLEGIIRDAIISYNDSTLNKFNFTLRQSRLSNLIDSSDPSMVSTDIFAKPIIEYKPILGDLANPLFDFSTALVVPYGFNETEGFDAYKPTIETTRFTLSGTLVTLQDDGRGNILAVTADSATPRVFKKGVGTVDYETGKVRLTNFVVDDYNGNAIKFYANNVDKDIKSTKDRILVVRNEDIRITMSTI
jgi:hypothetical protein